MSPFPHVAVAAVFWATAPCPVFDNDRITWRTVAEAPDTVYAVRCLLFSDENDGPDELIRRGRRPFPIYLKVFADRCIHPREKGRLMYVLSKVGGDRSMFIDPAVSLLTAGDGLARGWAAVLLAEVGGPKEAAQIARLLADPPGRDDVYDLTYALARIGGPDELTAVEAWLKGGKHRDDPALVKYVAEERDKLKARLAAAAPPAKK